MTMLLVILIILIAIMATQVWAFTKFIRQMKLGKGAHKIGYKIFRAIWLVIDSIAFISILLLFYTSIKASIIVKGHMNQAYGWVPFIICLYIVIPSNVVAAVFRIIYLESDS